MWLPVSCAAPADENTADYALDVLTRQLAVLADQRGYLPPPYRAESTTSSTCWKRPPAPAPNAAANCSCWLTAWMNTTPRRALTWPPGCPTPAHCPSTALLLVASRAGADVHLPPAHPLCDHVQRITASEAATEIRHAAHAELEKALKAPRRIPLPLGLLSGGRRKRADG